MGKSSKFQPLIMRIVPSNGRVRYDCFAEKVIRIGRRSANDISLSDPGISRYHAEILNKNRGVMLQDCNSANGIYLNGNKTQQSDLNKEDTIDLGKCRITFEPALTQNREAEICLEKGSEYLGREKIDLASAVMHRALTVQPDNPAIYFLLTRVHLGQSKYDKANVMVEKGLTLSPVHPEAFFLKGLIEDRRGNWNEARRHYEKSLELDGNYEPAKKKLNVLTEKAGLYEKLNTLILSHDRQTAEVLPDDWADLESGPFTIRFRLRDNVDHIKKVIQTLIRAHQKMGDKLGYFPKRVPVEIYSSLTEFSQKIGKENEAFASWAAGVSGDFIAIHLNPEVLKDPPFLYMVLTHEYVHFVLHKVTQANCPFWLGEGLAQFESQNLSPGSLDIIKQASAGNYLMPLELLESAFELLDDNALIKLAYAQSYSVVEYIIERYGYSRLIQIIQDLAHGKPMTLAIETLETSYTDLEQDWSRWLKDSK